MRIFLGLLIPLSFAAGCDQACTEIAVASVSLEVQSGDDARPLPDAEVSFTVDDGEQRTAEALGEGSFVLAYEEVGVFDVEVTAPGHERVERSYTVDMDAEGCHVEGVQDEIVLAVQE